LVAVLSKFFFGFPLSSLYYNYEKMPGIFLQTHTTNFGVFPPPFQRQAGFFSEFSRYYLQASFPPSPPGFSFSFLLSIALFFVSLPNYIKMSPSWSD